MDKKIINYLAENEKLIQSKFSRNKWEKEQAEFVLSHIPEFKNLYLNYEIPQARAEKIFQMAEYFADHIFNDDNLRIALSGAPDIRLNLFNKISNYLARNSSESFFRLKNEHTNPANIHAGMMNDESANGQFILSTAYSFKYDMEIFSGNIYLDFENDALDLLKSFTHEYWHFNQIISEQSELFNLNYKFYFTYDSKHIPHELNHNMAYQMYVNQPIEKDARLFTKQVMDRVRAKLEPKNITTLSKANAVAAQSDR